MLFTQIIAFVVVMVVWEAYRPAPPVMTPTQSLAAAAGLTAWLWISARLSVIAYLRRLTGHRPPPDPARGGNRLISWLQAAGVLAYALMVTLLELKAHLSAWPLLEHSETLSGLCAVGIYLVVLLAVWSAIHPLERVVFQRQLSLLPYLGAQARFVAPVAFPWLAVAILRDLSAAFWPRATAWWDTAAGELVFLSLFLGLMALFFPPLVRAWWGCRRWPEGPVREVCTLVLEQAEVRVAEILRWPVLQGRLLTAGILGVAGRFRYLLLTPALVEALSAEELAGVVAHEAGHVRHRHLVTYLVFFAGFFLAAYALSEPIGLGLSGVALWLAEHPWGRALLLDRGQASAAFSVMMALPLVALLIVYLRFVMGFFMRHFERQADFFALRLLGRPDPLVSALEKVALLSGQTREVPSWHHFSIAQRVAALHQAAARPETMTQHAARVRYWLRAYLVGLAVVVALGAGTSLSGWQDTLHRRLVVRLVEARLQENPHNARLHLTLGILEMEAGRERRALTHLGAAVRLAPDDPEALNSLAWLLATAKDPDLRHPRQAVALALAAVQRAPRPHIWDTLAEAYFRNGQPHKALAAARAALAARPTRRLAYYRRQLERFQKAVRESQP